MPSVGTLLPEPDLYTTGGACAGHFTTADNNGDLYANGNTAQLGLLFTMAGWDTYTMNGTGGNAGKCVEADGAWPKFRACTGATNQLWKSVRVGSGQAAIYLAGTGSCLRMMNANNCRLYVAAPASDTPCIAFDAFDRPSPPPPALPPSPFAPLFGCGCDHVNVVLGGAADNVYTDGTGGRYEQTGEALSGRPVYEQVLCDDTSTDAACAA